MHGAATRTVTNIRLPQTPRKFLNTCANICLSRRTPLHTLNILVVCVFSTRPALESPLGHGFHPHAQNKICVVKHSDVKIWVLINWNKSHVLILLGATRKKGSGDWRKLHNVEFHHLYSSSRIFRMIKSIKNNEMGEAYSTRGKEAKCIKFCLENLKEIATR